MQLRLEQMTKTKRSPRWTMCPMLLITGVMDQRFKGFMEHMYKKGATYKEDENGNIIMDSLMVKNQNSKTTKVQPSITKNALPNSI